MSGGASESVERIVKFALRLAASGCLPQSVTEDSVDGCSVESNADGLSFVMGTTRRDVRLEDLQAIWCRFEEWTMRTDKTADFAVFFEDLNCWGTGGQIVIRKAAALLLFAKAIVSEADKMRWEEFWERVQWLLPARREFVRGGGRGRYPVTFSRLGDSLLFEKEGGAVWLGPWEMRAVWCRFVEWWCLPSRNGADDLKELGGSLGGDASFYAFELACLMNELQQGKVF